MAKPGPRKKSATTQARRNHPGKRKPPPPRKKAVTLPPGVPEPPLWLGVFARQEWIRLAPIVSRHGLLSELDLDVLAIYCDAFEQLLRADEVLREEGEFLQTSAGTVYPHPALAKRHKVIDRLRKVGEQLGLTPNSRRGLELPAAADPLTDYMSSKPR